MNTNTCNNIDNMDSIDSGVGYLSLSNIYVDSAVGPHYIIIVE